MLSLNLVKYKVAVKNLEWTWYSKYPITDQERSNLLKARKDKDPFVWIHDIDWNRVREINPRDIKEFEPISKWQSHAGYNVVCDFWGRHSVHNWEWACECEKYFKCNGSVFKDKLKEVLWLDIFYSVDITEDIRKQYLAKINNS